MPDPKQITFEGQLTLILQEGGYADDSIWVSDQSLDSLIREWIGKQHTGESLVETIEAGHCKITVEILERPE